MDINFKKMLKNTLVEYFSGGIKEQNKGMLGIELEHIVLDKNGAASFFGENGIGRVLEEISCFYDEKSYSEGRLIALKRKNCLITLEPAAQLEVSIGEFFNIEDFEREYNKFLNEISPILKKLSLRLLNIGYQPMNKAEDLPLIPKKRYRIMDEHFISTGKHGKNMMRGTAATQVSIDYFSADDFAKKFRLAGILTPIFSLITDNSPIFEKEISSGLARAKVWQDVDPDRSGVVKISLDKQVFGFEDYAEYILNKSPIAIIKENDLVKVGNFSSYQIYSDIGLNLEDTEHILSMFFPYVRLKKYIEIRAADSMPIEYALGYTALIKGIFYSENNLNKYLDEFSFVDSCTLDAAFNQIINKGFDAEVYGIPVYKLAKNLCERAKSILTEKEKTYLSNIEKLVDLRIRPLNLAKWSLNETGF